MADPAKSQPGWSFPSTTTAGNTSNLFGQTTTNTSKAPNSNVFGATSNVPGTSTPSLFGGASTQNQGSGLFGGGNTGGSSNQNQSSNLLGSGNNAGGNTFGAASPSSGAGFNFGQSQSEQPPKPPALTAFGGASNTGNNSLLGNLSSPTSSSTPFAASTPTSKPAGGFSFLGAPSTTPAGPPPSNPLSFGAQKSQEQSNNAFSLGQPKTSAPENPSTSATSNLFGGASTPSGNLFQTNQSATSKAETSTSQPAQSIFAAAATNNSGSNIFGSRPEAQPTAGLFNNLPKLNDAQASSTLATSDGQQSKAEPPKPLFPNLGGQSAAPGTDNKSGGLSMFPSTTQAANASKPAFSLPTSTSKPADSNAATLGASSLFGVSNPNTGAAAPSAPAPANNMFAHLTKASDKPTDAKASTTATSAPSLAVAAPLSSGSSDAKPVATSSTMQPPAPKVAEPSSSTSGNANLGASTSGPAPTSQSRLKNKSMDEIITRWASDLSKYQKEFQRQAEQVEKWDQMLVENSDKIQKLYGNTLEAQRATAEVERQITVVENEQDELEHYLNIYESQVEEMWKAQGGGTDSLKGPDKERQET